MRERDMAIQGVRTLKRAYDAALKPVAEAHGLTRNEVDVLLFLANNPGYDTARDIVELCMLLLEQGQQVSQVEHRPLSAYEELL